MDLTDLRREFHAAALEACRAMPVALGNSMPCVPMMVAFRRLEEAVASPLPALCAELDVMADRIGRLEPEALDLLATKVGATRVRVLLTPRADLGRLSSLALEGLAAAGKSLAANLKSAQTPESMPGDAYTRLAYTADLVRRALATYDAEVGEVKATGRLARLG